MSDQSITAYPLSWPPAWPRCQYPARSAFQTDLQRAAREVKKELGMLGATNTVISCNAKPNRYGEFFARQERITDTGVAVYFTLRKQQKCIPCDKWALLEDNLHAIALTVRALRGLDRWGAKEIVTAAFQGFEALPATTSNGWTSVLGLESSASLSEIDAAYKRLAKIHHPDRGGNSVVFAELTQAYESAKKARSL